MAKIVITIEDTKLGTTKMSVLFSHGVDLTSNKTTPALDLVRALCAKANEFMSQKPGTGGKPDE